MIHNRHSHSFHTNHRQMCSQRLKDSCRNEKQKPVLKAQFSKQKRNITETQGSKVSLIICLPGILSAAFRFHPLSYQNVCLAVSLWIIYFCWITCSSAANQERKEAAVGDENCFPVTDCANQSSTKEIRSKRWPIIAKHCCTHGEKELMHTAQKSNSWKNVAELAI